MGWFSSSSSSSPSSSSSSSSPVPSAASKSEDQAPLPPTRSDRQQCWAARDAFFVCLDAHGIINAIEHADEASSHCAAAEKKFKEDCASSWVTYFKQRRVMEHKKSEMLRGLKEKGAEGIGG